MSWQEIRPLRAYAEVALGRQRSPAHDQGPNMVPYLRAANVKDGVLDLEDVKEMNFTPAEQQIFQLRPGDVLVTEGSGSVGAVGASAVWVGELAGPVCFQNTVLRLRPRGMTDGRFLGWWCRHAFADGLFASVASGANIFHLSAERVRSLPATHLALEQQRAIADFLDAETARIDSLVAKKRRLLLALHERFLEKARRLVTGGRFLSDPLDVRDADLVDGWHAARLGRELIFGSGTTPPAGDDRFYGPGVPWIVTADLRDADVVEAAGSVTDRALAELSALRIHPAGSLVVAMYGATVGRLGFTTSPATVNQACCAILPDGGIHLRFLFFYLLAHRSVLLERTVGAGQPNVSQQILRSIHIAVPSRSDQARIAHELLCERRRGTEAGTLLDRQIALLREHRQALITAAVTGELEIPGVAA